MGSLKTIRQFLGFRRQRWIPVPNQGCQRVEGSRQERPRVDADRRVRTQLHHRRTTDAEVRQEREDRLPRFLTPEGQDEDGSSGNEKS
jgi:hypothetical protein